MALPPDYEETYRKWVLRSSTYDPNYAEYREPKKREPPTSRLVMHRTFRNGKRVVTAEYRPYASRVVLKHA